MSATLSLSKGGGPPLADPAQQAEVFGTVVGTQSFYPFGEVRPGATGVFDSEKGFTGQIRDTATGLNFYNAKYQDPVLGRFISPDRIVPNPYEATNFNRFAYVTNGPTRYVDPTGYLTCAYGDTDPACDAWDLPSLESGEFETASYDPHFAGYFDLSTHYGAIEVAEFFRPSPGDKAVMITDGTTLSPIFGGGSGDFVAVDSEGLFRRGDFVQRNVNTIDSRIRGDIRVEALNIDSVVDMGGTSNVVGISFFGLFGANKDLKGILNPDTQLSIPVRPPLVPPLTPDPFPDNRKPRRLSKGSFVPVPFTFTQVRDTTSFGKVFTPLIVGRPAFPS